MTFQTVSKTKKWSKIGGQDTAIIQDAKIENYQQGSLYMVEEANVSSLLPFPTFAACLYRRTVYLSFVVYASFFILLSYLPLVVVVVVVVFCFFCCCFLLVASFHEFCSHPTDHNAWKCRVCYSADCRLLLQGSRPHCFGGQLVWICAWFST